jgi:hypothetical protein
MTQSPPITYQHEWTVNLDACEVRHVSGLVVRFTRSENAWDGHVPNVEEWVEQNPAVHMKLAARLMREAGEVYKHALDERQ